MKKILISFSVVLTVAAITVYATSSFFSDTETSAGNIFTAGSIDLKVDSKCSYNGNTQNCSGNWGQENGIDITNEKFFDFADLKPGDSGENTISLHVIDNDAYVCAMIDNMQNNDNGLTEPESNLDQTGENGEGELAQEVNFFAWADDGDNIWEENESPLFSNTYGPASDVLDGKVYSLYTPQTVGALASGTTGYIGLYWCYGNITVRDHELSCDGSSVTNLTQTDSLSADIKFHVEQARNNENFVCPSINEDPTNERLYFIEDFEDTTGFTTGGVGQFWGITPLEGTNEIPSYFIQGGNQAGNIFYGSFGKAFPEAPSPLMTINLPDLSGYTNLRLFISLAATDLSRSSWEISHRDSLIISGNTGIIDRFLPISSISNLQSQVFLTDLHYNFQNYEYPIDSSLNSLTFTFASTAYDEVVGIDSVIITGDPITP